MIVQSHDWGKLEHVTEREVPDPIRYILNILIGENGLVQVNLTRQTHSLMSGISTLENAMVNAQVAIQNDLSNMKKEKEVKEKR